MNKYSKLSIEQMLSICKLINPDCKWEFNQLLDNDGKGTDDCYEFVADDGSCIQFNIHQPAEDEIRCYLKGNWDDDKIPVDKIELVNDFLGIETVIKKQDTNDDPNKIKQHYVLGGEIDKFTKIAEYYMPFPRIFYRHIDTATSLGMEIIYRYRNEEDNTLMIKVKLRGPYYKVRNALKEAMVLFLMDDNEIIQTNQVLHYTIEGNDPVTESAYLKIDLAFLSKLVFANKIEYRVSGKEGIISEGELGKTDLVILKGFYNGLFDPEFMKDELLEQVEADLAAKRKEEEEKEMKKNRIEAHSSSNCFIITATMGNPYHPIVYEFRSYRDRKLLTNTFGKAFVSIYYKVGPYAASIISKSELLKKISFSFFVHPIYRRIKNDRNTNKN
jgi:hypothetical protein